MNAHFRGRQGKYEPATARVHGGKIEKIAEEGAVGFGVVAIEEDMGADDSGQHGVSLSKGNALAELRSAGQPGAAVPTWVEALQNPLTGVAASAIFLGMSFLTHLHHCHHAHSVLAG